MQNYKVTYVPKTTTKVSRKAGTVVEVVPLADPNSSVLRALHPNMRMVSVVPTGEHLKDVGQYAYYSLDISYSPGPYRGNLCEDEGTRLASNAATEAEHTLILALTRLRLEYQHSYSWPDGALYYDIRILASEDIADVKSRIDKECEEIQRNPIKLKYKYKNSTTFSTYEVGAQQVRVKTPRRYDYPWESEGRGFTINMVDSFENDPLYMRMKHNEDAKDYENKLHTSFERGMQEAYGHPKLFYIRLIERTEEEINTFAAGYILGKLILALTVPDNVSMQPWTFVYEPGQSQFRIL